MRLADKTFLYGVIFAATGSIAFSLKAIIVKLGYRYGVDAITLLFLRMFFALPFFIVMSWRAHKKNPIALQGADWLALAGLGFCGYYLASVFDFYGLLYISASLERLILYLTPTLVLAIGWFVRRQPVSRVHLIASALSYSGVVLVFSRDWQHAADSGSNVALGAVLVFASAASYACYLFYSGEFVRRVGALRLVGLATTFACLFSIAHFAFSHAISSLADVPPEVIWLSVLNAVVSTAIAVLLVMMAIERIGAALTAQIGMIGPLSTIFMSILVLDEAFTLWLAIGTLMVIGGIFLFGRGERLLRAAQQKPADP